MAVIVLSATVNLK